MPKWIRLVLALIAGVISGGVTIAVIEMVGHTFIKGQAIFGVAAFGLGLAAFVGGSVAAMVSRTSKFAWIVACVLAGLSLINIMSFKHPNWYVPVAFISLGLGAWLSTRLYKFRGKRL